MHPLNHRASHSANWGRPRADRGNYEAPHGLPSQPPCAACAEEAHPHRSLHPRRAAKGRGASGAGEGATGNSTPQPRRWRKCPWQQAWRPARVGACRCPRRSASPAAPPLPRHPAGAGGHAGACRVPQSPSSAPPTAAPAAARDAPAAQHCECTAPPSAAAAAPAASPPGAHSCRRWQSSFRRHRPAGLCDPGRA